MKQMIRVLSFAALAGLLASCGDGYVLIDSKGQVGIEQRNLIYIQIVMMLLVVELLSNLVYGIQAAFSVDCSSSCLPSLKMTLLTTKVNKLNP